MVSKSPRKPLFAWALCDWANSAFATTVMAGFFPLFFKQYWNADVAATESTFRLGLTNGVASLLVAVLAPLLGVIADKSALRVRLLMLFTVLGAAMTAALYLVAQGQWLFASILYVMASLGFWGSNQFYDSLLPVVANRTEYDRASAYGYSLGYLGGGLLFAANVLLVTQPASFGLESAAAAVKLSFASVAIWWLIFTLPAFFMIRETREPGTVSLGVALRSAGGELRAMWQYLRQDKILLWFLLAYWFYIDGVNTIIKMAVDYGLSLGLPQDALIKALLLVQFIGFPAALLFGRIGQFLGPRTGIFIAIGIYACATVYAYFMQTAQDFYALAVIIGLVQGGIQSLSRSLYARLIPVNKSAEYFGLYNLMGKAAAILGPILAGSVALITQDSRLGILSITILFAAGAFFLRRLPRI